METINDELKPTLMNEEPPPNEMAEYLRIIERHIRTILAIAFIAMLASTLFFSVLPNIYTANCQILVEKVEAPKSYRDELLMPTFRGEEDYYGTQIAILTGRKVMARAERELGYPLKNTDVQAKRQRGTRIILLTVTHPDPVRVAQIANKIAEVYLMQSAEESFFMSRQILKLTDNANASAAKPVDSAEAGSPPPSQEALEEAVQTEARSADAASGKKELVQSLTGDPMAQQLKQEKVEIEAKINELSQRYRPQHPEIRRLNERLSYIDTRLDERTDRFVSNLRANLTSDVKIGNVRILEEALVPDKPSGPQRLKGIFINTVLGFVFGVVFVVLYENINQKVRSDEDLRVSMHIPFLGYIPAVKELQKNKKKNAVPAWSDVSIVEVLETNVILSDAVANVRTHILFSMPYEKSRRIMLTSAMPNEGKTTVSALLALSLAALKRNILLIDADLRRPFLHTYFKLKNEKGLCDYLIGAAKPEEIIRSIEGTSLKLVTGGITSPNPSELLSSQAFRDFLEKMQEKFDRIVIDVPPVLYMPDGLIVAKHVHSGVLVCGSGMVDKKIIKRVRDKFDAVGHSFIGAIINRADYAAQGYKYKYYRYYKDYYVGKGKGRT